MQTGDGVRSASEPVVDERMRRATITMVMLNSVATAMMLSAVNVALPNVARDLHLTATLLSWVPMSYLMASAACVLPFGRLADMYGRKRIFLLGNGGVIAASLVTACAVGTVSLICGRLLQGVSAAMVFATNIAIVTSVFPPARRGVAVGYTISAVYFGLALGPLLSGWLIEFHSWRATFVVHVPLAVIVLYIGLTRLPIEWRADERGDFDPLGAVLNAIAMVVLMTGVSNLPGSGAAAMVVAGLACGWLFFRHEHRHPHPLFDVELFYTNRVFTMSCLASLVMYTTTFANVVLISLFLQYLKNTPPSTTGLVMIAQPVMMTLLSPLAGRLSDRIEPRIIASAGMAVTALGLAALATLGPTSSLTTVVGCLLTTGVGFSLFSSPNVNAIMGTVGRNDYGRVASAISVARVVGQMSSMGLVAMVMALWVGPVHIEPAVYPQLACAISTCFGIGAALCACGIGLSLARGRMHGPV